MPLRKNTEPKQRYLTRNAAGQRELTRAEISALNDSLDFRDDLGIDVRGGVPATSNTENYTPRMFVMQTGADMSDEVKSFSSSSLKNCWDAEFWKQVQLGNVFVYPARSSKPCQLQLDRGENGRLSLSLSRPLEPDQIPRRETKKPNGWHRFWHRIYAGFYQDRVESCDNAQKSRARVEATLREYEKDRSRSCLSDEADAEIRREQQEAMAQPIVLAAAGMSR